jgi:hypothetical protein
MVLKSFQTNDYKLGFEILVMAFKMICLGM